MKILRSKKGVEIVEYWPYWIFFAIATAVVIIILVKIANVSVVEASKIPEDTEDEVILASRFFNSGDCFAYKDDAGRVHPYVIDEDKFTQDIMNKCFQRSDPSNVKYAFSLMLLKYPPAGETGSPTSIGPITTFNYIAGGYSQKEIINKVLVFHEGVESNGGVLIKIKNV